MHPMHSEGQRSQRPLKHMICGAAVFFCWFFGLVGAFSIVNNVRSYNNAVLTNLRIDNIVVEPWKCARDADMTYDCFTGILELSNKTLERYCGAIVKSDVSRDVVERYMHRHFNVSDRVDLYYEPGYAYCVWDHVLWTSSLLWSVIATVVCAIVILVIGLYFFVEWWKRPARRVSFGSVQRNLYAPVATSV